jgi:hypothetical protein
MGLELAGCRGDDKQNLQRKEAEDMSNMEYKLNTEAIRKRFAEAVVVVRGGDIFILLRACEDAMGGLTYFSLTSGSPWHSIPTVGENGVSWLIRPGDMAEFSQDGRHWSRYGFRGFSGTAGNPFLSEDGRSEWRYIRPISQSSPEKVKVMEQIAKMEKELAELKSRAEKMECKPC